MAEKKIPGLVQWFSFEDRESVEKAIEVLKDLQVTELRTLFSWADWEREGGQEWYDWFVSRLAEVPSLRLVPSLFYTPMQYSMKKDGKTQTSYPPEDLSQYAKFVRTMIERHGKHFDWIQLWNEPNWKPYWEWDLDPTGEKFAKMATGAAQVCHELGKKVLLGGTTPLDYAWFGRMAELGLLQHCDAVSFHNSPSWDNQHRHWMPLPTEINTLRHLLNGFELECEIWLDESGISTNTASDHDERKLEQKQIEFFDEIRALDAERVFWFCLFDQPENIQTDDAINTGMQSDPTAYHFGLITSDGRKKPLYEHWKQLAG